jgi:hypothetical protein
MPEQSDAALRDLLSRIDEIFRESRSIRERIGSAQSRRPEWPDRRDVSEMFDFRPAEYDHVPPRSDDDK